MIRAVLFDLDGTLLHSAPDLVAALNWLRERNGLQALPLEELQNSASRGAVGLLSAGMPRADAETLETWRLEFLARYEQFSFAESELFEGVADLLGYLEEQGIPWGIVTNKPEHLAVPILSAAGLSGAIGCLVCGDTLEERKPHPAPVLLACERLNVAPADTVFVGDDLRDLEAGIAAGAITCAAMYGYGSGEFLKPEYLDLLKRGFSIEGPTDLLHWLRRDRERCAVP